MNKLRPIVAPLLLAASAGLASTAFGFDPVIVPAGEAQRIEVLGSPMDVLVRNAQTDGDFSIVVSMDGPGGGPGPAVRHKDRTETFYVLEGEYTFYSDGKEIKAGPGSIIVNPKGVPHGFVNTGTTQGKLLMIYSPGGFEDFFIEVAEKKVQPSPELAALENKYGASRPAPQ
jgi:mannose-6-phosphate isomerase-like protein (cupin superfamily)